MVGETGSADASAQGQSVDGAVDGLRGTRRLLERRPEVIALFLLVAPLTAAMSLLGGLLRTLGVAIAVYMLGSRLPARVEPGANSNTVAIRLLVVVLAALLSGLAIILGLLFFVLPGLYLFARLYLVIPAVVLGDDGPVEAMASSWDRTDGHVLTVAGVAGPIFLVGTLVTVIVLVGIAGGIDPAIDRVRGGDVLLATAAETFVTGPLTAAAMAALYDGLEA